MSKAHFQKEYKESTGENCHYLVLEVNGPQGNAENILASLEKELIKISPDDDSYQNLVTATIIPLWSYAQKLGAPREVWETMKLL